MSLYSFTLIHAKSKTRFSSGKPRNIILICLHVTEKLTELLITLFSRNLCVMLKLQCINSMQYSEPVVIQTQSQSCNEINTHTEHLVQKHNNFLSSKRSYLVLNEEKRKQRKANRIITLDGEQQEGQMTT